jgi:2-amino-4-hydroxy-6-hydroxymethyldihydropteridine diphosphokinase
LILVGVGANLPSPRFGPPRATCGAALAALSAAGITVARCSRWYHSAPVPPSDQPWFVNAVVHVTTALTPAQVLAVLLRIEETFGRRRGVPNAARILDLDLLDYHGRISAPGEEPILPHPRLEGRAFVLLPLSDLAPDWRHPVTGASVATLIAGLPKDQMIEAMALASGLFGTEWLETAAGPPK